MRFPATHSQRLERWIGRDHLERISQSMLGWHGPPIALAGVPGAVYAGKDGDFVGHVAAGRFGNYVDHMRERTRRAMSRWARRQLRTYNTGFASLSDLISEASGGAKSQHFPFQKVGTTGVANATNSLWAVGNLPPAGAAGSAAPGGRACDKTTTGAFTFNNPTGGDTQHFVTGHPLATNVGTLLLYDRIFDVTKTMNSTATEAVTGVPTRYTSTTATAQDYAGGNFLFIECTTVLAATAHNWTVCLYTNQAGTAAQTIPSVTGNSGNIVNRDDQPTGQFFVPLSSGDTGISALTQMQCSALVATGAIDFVMGHAIAWMPCPIAEHGLRR